MADMKGGCLCGRVRYTISADPVFSGVCHCKSCQKGNGSAFSVVVAVPSPGVSVTGATTTYVGQGDSGGDTRRRFCPVCGSPVVVEAEMMPGISMIEVGTLDDPTVVTPAMHIYCRSKMAWTQIPDGLKTFDTMPTGG